MPVTSTAMALGNWSFKLRTDTPRSVLDAIQYFGHVAVSTGRPDPRVSGDSLLTSARYVGVLRGKQEQVEGWSLSGSGMAFWIGDENDKGPVITNQLLLDTVTFTSAINQCLAAGNAVVAGTLYAVIGSYKGVHQWQTTRKAITYICSTMTSDYTDPVEWRVNGNATLDAGNVSQLYVTNPKAAIVRRHAGADMAVRALPGKAITNQDVTDFRTRQILLAQGGGLQLSSGVANIAAGLNPYKDLRGNPVAITATSSESSTNPANANARAAIVLSQYQNTRQAVQLSTSQFDIRGDVAVGDWVWVQDPDAGLVDTANEIVFRGERINPLKLRVKEMSWPIARGMSVSYRDNNGTWLDLTDYVIWESGDTHVVVGGYDRSLINPAGLGENLGSRAMPNTTIPGVPAFTLPWDQAVYQSPNSGITKAQVKATWGQPANTDGTAIIDGDHYEIQYRPSSTPVYPATWAQVAGKQWGQLNTWGQPIAYQTGPWQVSYASWDTTAMLIQELTPGQPYEFQIRAVDTGISPNFSAWSASNVIQTGADTIPPSPPAAPSVAASRIAVQITHSLGKSSGGTFNLEPDLHHLEIHGQYEPLFTPTASTLLGKLICNNGMMMAGIPAVGTFPVESVNPLYFKVIAVDEAGNKSGPSTAAQSTAKLIDDAHISDLTVTKVTAGTIMADFLLGARIKTANTGARVELNTAGLQAYDVNNVKTVDVKAADGSATLTGTMQSGTSGQRVVVNPAGTTVPEIHFYPSTTTKHAYINALYNGADVSLGLNSGPDPGGTKQSTLLLGTTYVRLSPTLVGTNTMVGGSLAADNTGVLVGFRDNSGTVTASHFIDSGGVHNFLGMFPGYVANGATQALMVFPTDVPAGFTSTSPTYGATMAGRFNPVASVYDQFAVNTFAAVTAQSATGFTVSYPNAHAVTVNCWVFRTP